MSDFTSVIIYLITYSVSAYFLHKGLSDDDHKNNKILIFLALILPILLAAFRYRVGTDFVSYMNRLEQSRTASLSDILNESYLEVGFTLIERFSSFIGDRNFFFGFNAFLTILPIYFIFKNQYKKMNIGIAYFLYLTLFFTISFNIVRQMIAVSIIFWGFKFIFQKKMMEYIIVVLIAILFHSSAIVALPVYFFWVRKEEVKTPPYRAIIGILIISLSVISFQLLLNLLSQLPAFSHFYAYTIRDTRGQNRDFFLKLAVLVFLFIQRKYLIKLDKRYEFLLLLQFITVIIGFTGFITPFVKRSALYFNIGQTILMSSIPLIYKNNDKLLIKFLIILYGIIYFILVFFILRQGNIIPYRIR